MNTNKKAWSSKHEKSAKLNVCVDEILLLVVKSLEWRMSGSMLEREMTSDSHQARSRRITDLRVRNVLVMVKARNLDWLHFLFRRKNKQKKISAHWTIRTQHLKSTPPNTNFPRYKKAKGLTP